MPEENEKVEDFISLWKKKMENEIETPSAIGETIERIKQVEEENERLRNKIKENIELITKTEVIITKTIEENKSLKQQLKNAGMVDNVKVSDIQQENKMLNNKVISLEKNLTEKEVELISKINEINDLKMKLEAASTTSKEIESSTAGKGSEITTALIDNLKSELSKKKTKVNELENRISELTEENESLNKELLEKMKKLPIDYVIPVEEPKSSVIKPLSTKPSSETLEILCQDLQSDLNKYKKIVEKLNKEKSELAQTIESGGFQLEPEELKILKRDNEELKNELSQIQKSLQNKSQEATWTTQINEADKKIKNLQEQLEGKDHLIVELKAKQQSQPIVHKGPMSGLIEDLQNKINKLKLTINEKNKIIEELKSS
ncbi:MAG: hypothetical protein CEE43_00855 [Promethearchaeota archaeon Loki_b32]|nr:MAG: hypothetical protein CEE43_00855 [Candidatus Lokiarchaeota archaeon Loki_b32]